MLLQEGVDEFGAPSKRSKAQASGLSVMDVDNASMYRPKTKETREAYEMLLSVIHQQFGEQPQVRPDSAGGKRTRASLVPMWCAGCAAGCSR